LGIFVPLGSGGLNAPIFLAGAGAGTCKPAPLRRWPPRGADDSGLSAPPEGQDQSTQHWGDNMPSEFVKEKDRRRIAAFVEVYQKSPYARAGGQEPSDVIPSPIDEEMIHDHENLLGATLPPLFRAYLLTCCLPDTDLYVGQLPLILPNRPFKYVDLWSIEKMDQPFYCRNKRLMPFTHGPADCSDFCFDIYRPDATGDYPIIDVWHLRMDGETFEWSDVDCERSQAYSSFSKYLDHLQEWLVYRTVGSECKFEDWLRTRGTKELSMNDGEPRG
jgi:hypothetical protein